ncbi:uncharacterized protein LOC144146636 [Haemaphysalis longicornis]
MAGRQHDFSSRLEEFTGSNWSSWFGRLQFFFEANDVTDPVKQRAHLLTLSGAHIYDVVCALLQPKTPDRVSYAEIVAALQPHYDPRPSEVYSRAMFQRRDQLPGESVNDYVAALRKLATSCNFGTLPTATAPPATQAGGAASTQQGATDYNPTLLPLDVMSRDRFVCGLRDENLQQRLFAEKELTFTKAYDFAIRAESAVQQQQKIKTDHAEVNKAAAHASDSATNSKAHSQGQRCWRCDGSHSPKTCTGCSLLGRNWFDKLGIELHGIHQTTDEGILTKLLRKYDDVFCEDTTGHTGPPINLELKEGASPTFFKARPVPFAMRASSEAQIDKYVEDAAPAIFQRFMETTLSGLPGVCVYLDDIIVSGATAKEHKDRLGAVLERLAQANLRLCKSKCQFGVVEVKFLGHKIDAAGIHTSDDKVEAIVKAPAPKSKQTLQSFLGMLAFYDRFLERRATVASTLYELLAKDKTWKWEQRHQKAFDELKQCRACSAGQSRQRGNNCIRIPDIGFR